MGPVTKYYKIPLVKYDNQYHHLIKKYTTLTGEDSEKGGSSGGSGSGSGSETLYLLAKMLEKPEETDKNDDVKDVSTTKPPGQTGFGKTTGLSEKEKDEDKSPNK